MPRNSILIIDDEPETVRLLRFALERAGFVVLTSRRAEDALQQAHNSAPDAVLLALELGEKNGEVGNGLKICKQLRADAQTAHLPIILITAKLRSDFKTVEGFKSGADDYIMKPFRPSEVVARVQEWLHRTQRNAAVSPLTDLPASAATEKELARVVAAEQPFGALFIDLDKFAHYNEIFGTARGDDVLRDLARCIAGAVSHFCAGSFIGHGSGDDFVVITTPEMLEPLARGIIASVNQVVRAWYPADAADTEYLQITLSIVGVTNEVRRFRNALEVAAVGAETMRAIKNKPGSHYLKDRRATRLPEV